MIACAGNDRGIKHKFAGDTCRLCGLTRAEVKANEALATRRRRRAAPKVRRAALGLALGLALATPARAANWIQQPFQNLSQVTRWLSCLPTRQAETSKVIGPDPNCPPDDAACLRYAVVSEFTQATFKAACECENGAGSAECGQTD